MEAMEGVNSFDLGVDDDESAFAYAWDSLGGLVAENCGTGAGGFKPGNDCAKGGGSSGGWKQRDTKILGARMKKRRTGVAVVDIKQITADPKRFQYKIEGIGDAGVTRQFADVKFNPELAGLFYVWHDPDTDKIFVVNGHHRYELAKSSKWEGQIAVQFIDRNTAEEARAFGALINIAQGAGTPLDAAKFMRDMGMSGREGLDYFKSKDISLSGSVAADSLKLANLSDQLFSELVYGRLDLGSAKAIGEELSPTPEDKESVWEAQNKLLALIRKSKTRLSADVVREMALNVAMAPRASKGGAQKSLFGDGPDEEILFAERAKVQAAVRDELTKDVRGFGAVSSADREDLLRKTGVGTVDSGVAASKKDAAEIVRAAFDRETRLRGEAGAAINSILNEAAKEYHSAKGRSAKNEVQRRATERIRELLAPVPKAGPGDAGQVGGRSQGDGGGGRSLFGESAAVAIENCGTGAGGFQPGNTCAAGGDSDMPSASERVAKAKRVDAWNAMAARVKAKTGMDSLDVAEKIIKADIPTADYDGQIAFMEKLIKEQGDKPHAWEDGMDLSFHPKNFQTGDWETPEKAADRKAWWDVHWSVRTAIRDSLSDSGLTKKAMRDNMESMSAALIRLPRAALEMVRENLKDVRWYPSTRTLTHVLGYDLSKGVVGGAWDYNSESHTGVMLLDGDSPNLSAKGVYAHELGHVIDWIRPRVEETEHGTISRRGGHISNTNEWREAFDEELGKEQLSKYGATSRSEGFAEFARYLAVSGLRPREVAAEFPKCYAVFQKYGYAK